MKALICITTCNRLLYLKYFLPNYISFCKQSKDFDFLVAVDGNETEVLEFLKKYKIPHLYSDEREGVGLSKNRVLKSLPDYDYYFFLDDDVELLNGEIFQGFIELSEKLNFHHMSCGKIDRHHGNLSNVTIKDERLLLSDFGNGIFNFFTKYGINKVGGFHTGFAEYKRYGHTEHSHRFKKSKLSPSPFIFPLKYASGYIRFRHPDSVTGNKPIWINPETSYCYREEELLYSDLIHFPLTTLSKYKLSVFEKTQWKSENILDERDIMEFKVGDYDCLVKEFDKSERKIIDLIDNKNMILNSSAYKLGRGIIKVINFFKI